MFEGGFTKLYGQRLLRSSVWMEPVEVRVLWLFFLAAADKNGYVDIPNTTVLAHLANMPLEATERALAVLEAPDPGSRSKEHEGRRLVREESGWTLVTHSKYREIQTPRQLADAERKRIERASKPADTSNLSMDKLGHVQMSAPDTDPNSDSDAESSSPTEKTTPAGGVTGVIASFEARYEPGLAAEARQACSLSRRNGKMRDSVWLPVLERLAKYPAEVVNQALHSFCERHADGNKDERYLIGLVRGFAKRSDSSVTGSSREMVERVKTFYSRLLETVETKPSWPEDSVRNAEAIARWAHSFDDPKGALACAFSGFEGDSWARQNAYPLGALAKHASKYHRAGVAGT